MSGRHLAATDTLPGLSAVQRLRADFDAAFSVAPAGTIKEFDDLLAIGVGGTRYAIRLRDITGIYRDKRVTALPGAPPELVGVAGFRGAIVAVYDLRVLLGIDALGPAPWIVLAASDSAVGLAFDEFEGQLRVPVTPGGTDLGIMPEPRHLRDSTSDNDAARPVVDVSGLVEAMTNRAVPIHKEW